MNEKLQREIQAEAARKLGQLMFDQIAADIELRELRLRLAKYEVEKPDAP